MSSADSPLRLGLVGASPGGSWAFTAHVPALTALPGVRISAVATTRRESAEAAAREVGADAWFTDAAALVNSDQVDVVSVVVKVPQHAVAVEAALRAGKPVYCEWPLALDAPTARRWASAAEESGLVTAVGLQGLSGSNVALLRGLVQRGELGEIRVVEAHTSRAKGLPQAPLTPGGSYTVDASFRAGTREVPGGHLLGLVEYLVGVAGLEGQTLKPDPGHLVDSAGNRHEVTAPDTFVASGRLVGGGLLVLDWWDRAPAPRTRVVIHGTRGTAELTSLPGAAPAAYQPQTAPLRLTLSFNDGEERVIEPPSSDLPRPAQHVSATYQRFLDDVRDGTASSVSFTTAARIHELLDEGIPAE